jgi:hypothetical protein
MSELCEVLTRRCRILTVAYAEWAEAISQQGPPISLSGKAGRIHPPDLCFPSKAPSRARTKVSVQAVLSVIQWHRAFVGENPPDTHRSKEGSMNEIQVEFKPLPGIRTKLLGYPPRGQPQVQFSHARGRHEWRARARLYGLEVVPMGASVHRVGSPDVTYYIRSLGESRLT